jgi:mono/diheme cytochrome c family protein
MINSVHRRTAAIPPPNFSEPVLIGGMREYEAHCMACHGGPGIDRARWASAMLPTPPFLVGTSQHWSRGDLYTIIHGGVKMTGMPAWGEVMSGDRIENVVTLLQAMPKLSPDQFAQLRARADAGQNRASSQRTVELSD